MTSAREVVLSRIRSAVAGYLPPEIPRGYRMTTPADVDLFISRLIDYKAVVHRCRADEIATVVVRALNAARVRRVILPGGLDGSWWPAIDAVRDAFPDVLTDDGSLMAADLDGEDVAVVTSCRVAIAETGTIVLDAGPGQGRRLLTLVPDHHICVVTSEQVVGSIPDAIRSVDPRRPLTWISGPSATVDIELRRVEGVHGPRHLVVIVVDGGIDGEGDGALAADAAAEPSSADSGVAERS